MRKRVKICGITQYEDAKVAANLGVDALGFIFYPKSPRYCSPEQAKNIVSKLSPFVSRVGVFVDESIDTVIEIAQFAGLDTIQLHGTESPHYCSQVPYPVVKAFSIDSTSDLSLLAEYDVAGFLLDTWHADMKGGTGMVCDWSTAKKACLKYDNVILAGGLGPTNIEEALKEVDPYGVDVNSGVEIKPGVKNPRKMRDVITLVQKWMRL